MIGPRPRAVVSAAVANRPRAGGHAWALLHWALGLRDLGWDVLVLDRLDDAMAHGPDGALVPPAHAVERSWFDEVMAELDLVDAAALLDQRGAVVSGPPRDVLLQRARGAVLLDVMGHLADGALLEAVERRIFVDVDPGFGQLWCAQDLADPFAGYDDFVTVGTALGTPACRVPTCGLPWIPTLPPVSLARWPFGEGDGRGLTAVGSWRGPFAPLVLDGERLGLRAHAMRELATLPQRLGRPVELALEIDPSDASDRDRLVAGGWRVIDPHAVVATPEDYRDYVRTSTAEVQVAKELHVRARTGWVSDRSACYLAAGRPVVAQDTGVTDALPAGKGFLAFVDADDAVAAVTEVGGNLALHRRAARELAGDLFDAPKVARRVLDAVGVA